MIRPRGPKAASVPPLAGPRGRGDSALGRPSFYQAKFLQVAGFVAECRSWKRSPRACRHWTATHPNLGIDVSSYWLPELRTLLDPIAVPDEVEGVQHILLSCRHHVRDSIDVRERFAATVRAPRTGMHDYPDDTPIVPYDFGEPIAGGAVTPYEVGGLSPDETALHIPAVNALARGRRRDPLRRGPDFVPDQYMDDPSGTRPI